MKKIHFKNLPARMPLNSTAIAYLLLDKFKVSELFWGIAIAFYSFLWIAYFVPLFKEEDIDIFDK